MKHRWAVCTDPDLEDEVVEAEKISWQTETGFLTFFTDGKPVAVFAPGKWVYLKDVTDEPR